MDYELFKSAVLKMTGIDLNAYKEKQMKRRIDSLISRHGANGYQEFVGMLKDDQKTFQEFVNYLTINVSEFYRNPEQWEYMDKEIFPELRRKFGNTLKIWSAACSTGDEPYSLVMALSKHVPISNIKIHATDIDSQVLEKAKVGLYNAKSIASVPKDLVAKYFDKIADSYQVKAEIKEHVEFQKHNLLADPYPRDQHLIVCRNVLIYFTDEAKDKIFRNYYNSLVPGGILFIGSTEQIVNYEQIGFVRKNSFYYEKK